MGNENEFPNIKAMGLYIEHDGMPGAYVSAHDLEKALSEAPEVFCAKPDKINSHMWAHRNEDGYDTHKARLVCIQPIIKEPVKYIKFHHDTFDKIKVPKELIGKPYTVTFEEYKP